MTTLVTDDFADNGTHYIVYGRAGHTDELSHEVIETLVGIGAIVLVEEVRHGYGRTMVYNSVERR